MGGRLIAQTARVDVQMAGGQQFLSDSGKGSGPVLASPRRHRESCHPSRFGTYKKFWSQSPGWRVFLLPCSQGFEASRDTPACCKAVNGLEQRPGVYEFAVSTNATSRKSKVYVGQTCDLKRRLGGDYRGDGSHLRALFDEALQTHGFTVWVRFVYTPTADAAKDWEARFLRKYDYAWNARDNKTKRALQLRRNWLCMTVIAT